MTDLSNVDVQELLAELSKRMSKGAIKAYLEQRKEVKNMFSELLPKMVQRQWEAPKLHFTYPPRDTFTVKHFYEWVDTITNFYHVAQYYEQQERGSALSVDRAYAHWLIPECKKMYKYILGGTDA